MQQTKPNIISIGNSHMNKPVVIKVNAELETLNIEIDAADVSITDVSIKKANITIDAGKLSFSNCIITDAEIEIDAGAVEYSGKILNKFICSVDVGSIDLNLNQKQDEFKINGIGQGLIVINLSVDVGSHNINYLEN